MQRICIEAVNGIYSCWWGKGNFIVHGRNVMIEMKYRWAVIGNDKLVNTGKENFPREKDFSVQGRPWKKVFIGICTIDIKYIPIWALVKKEI